MLSAPATIPATNEDTFNPAFALRGRHAQLPLSQALQPRPVGQSPERYGMLRTGSSSRSWIADAGCGDQQGGSGDS